MQVAQPFPALLVVLRPVFIKSTPFLMSYLLTRPAGLILLLLSIAQFGTSCWLEFAG